MWWLEALETFNSIFACHITLFTNSIIFCISLHILHNSGEIWKKNVFLQFFLRLFRLIPPKLMTKLFFSYALSSLVETVLFILLHIVFSSAMLRCLKIMCFSSSKMLLHWYYTCRIFFSKLDAFSCHIFSIFLPHISKASSDGVRNSVMLLGDWGYMDKSAGTRS